MKKYIQAEVSEETHRRFQRHQLRRRKNQRPFAAEILEKWLESPEAQFPILKEEIKNLSQRLDWTNRKLSDSLSRLEVRLETLEKRTEPATPPSEIAS